MKTFLQRFVFPMFAGILLALAGTGCQNTVEGVGDDIEEAGDKIEEKTD
jgi:predicted small secreted protein